MTRDSDTQISPQQESEIRTLPLALSLPPSPCRQDPPSGTGEGLEGGVTAGLGRPLYSSNSGGGGVGGGGGDTAGGVGVGGGGAMTP